MAFVYRRKNARFWWMRWTNADGPVSSSHAIEASGSERERSPGPAAVQTGE